MYWLYVSLCVGLEFCRIMRYYLLEYIMYSTINVKMGNKTLKTIAVSLPMFAVCKIKKIINPNVTACKIPNM